MALNFLNNGYFAGSVGIGVEVPGGKLDVSYTGTGGTGTFGIGEGLNITSFSPNMTFNDSSSGVDNYAIHLNQNVFTLGRYTSSTAQNFDLVLKSGNVGIGTDDPGRGLTINKSDQYAALEIINSSTTNQTVFLGTGSSGVADNTILQMKHSGVEKVRLYTVGDSFLNGGNFGIGTINPLAKIALETSGTFVLDSNGGDYSGVNIQMQTTNTTLNAIGSGIVWNKGASSRKVAAITNYIYGDADQSGLNFYVQPTSSGGSAVLTEAMRITNLGGISFGATGTAYGGVGQILKSNGNASPTWIDGSAIPGVPAGSGTLNTVAMWTPDGDTLGDAPITISGNNSTFAGNVTLNGEIYGRTSAAYPGLGGLGFYSLVPYLENANQGGLKIQVQVGASLVDSLTLDSSQNATFAGSVSAEDNIYLTDAGTVRAKLLLNASDRDNVELRAESLGSTMKFFTVGTEALELDASQNATFAGTIGSGTITSTGNVNCVSLVATSAIVDNVVAKTASGNITFKNNGGTTIAQFYNDKSATFQDQVFATVATSTGDAPSTLTTKGYVDGLITGATIYRGTWNPDKTQNSGYGVPDLSAVTQTSGYYYICSDIGIAEPNGAGCEPNSWAVGDWVIWNDDVPDCAGTGTGAWQKIDNSSVLSGAGTGQTVALWEGASSVTDSETLGNAPITISGNDSTFAGDVNIIQTTDVGVLNTTNLDNGSAVGLSLTYPTSNVAAGDGLAIAIGITGRGRSYIANSNTSNNLDASNLEFYTEGGGVINKVLTLDQSKNATFVGNVGIGVTPVSRALQVHGATSVFSTMLVSDSTSGTTGTGGGIGFQSDQGQGVSVLLAAIQGIKENSTAGSQDGALIFVTKSPSPHTLAERMRITSSGNVGIGTDDPDYTLHLLKSSGDTEMYINGQNGQSSLRMGIDFRNWQIKTSAAPYLWSLNYVGTDLPLSNIITANVGGNVGIGTDSPGFPLEVLNASAEIALNASGGSIYRLRSDSTDFFRINKNGVGDRLLIDGTGKVGIGVTSPQSKLQVDGGIQMADDDVDAVAAKAGTMRYRTATNEAVPVTGTELIINGDFVTDSDWTKGAGWTISGGTANGNFTSNPIYQTVSGFTAGNKYRVRFEVTAVTSGYVRVYAYVGASGTFTQIFSSTSLTTGVYEGTFEFGGTNKILRFYGSSGGTTFTGSIDNISVLEVTEEDASYADMCMQTGASTYEWVNIVRNTY